MLDIKIIIENKELFQSYFYLFSLILIKNKNNYFMGIDRRSIIYYIYLLIFLIYNIYYIYFIYNLYYIFYLNNYLYYYNYYNYYK